jgi:hypothetical protein
MKHPMFQNKNDKILINAVSACLSNLQDDETLSIKLWNELTEMNLVSLKVLDRVTPSLDILEGFLEEDNIREEVALHMIDAITRRQDFRVRITNLYTSTHSHSPQTHKTDTTSPDILCERKQITLCCCASFDCDEISSEGRSEYVDISRYCDAHEVEQNTFQFAYAVARNFNTGHSIYCHNNGERADE